jgi:hypothetical protein
MGVLIVAGISVGAIAFMTVFLIALCRESGRMKVYRIISANTTSMTTVANSRVASEGQRSIDATGTVLPLWTKPDKVPRSMDSRSRRRA